jgi:hypothetical protein
MVAPFRLSNWPLLAERNPPTGHRTRTRIGTAGTPQMPSSKQPTTPDGATAGNNDRQVSTPKRPARASSSGRSILEKRTSAVTH